MKKFFRKIVLFLHSLFDSLDTWIHEHIQPSIETVERLKNAFDNPAIDFLTAVIPGDLDDKIKDWIRVNLRRAIIALNISNDILTQPTTAGQLLVLINYIKTLSPSMQKGLYLRLASEMAISSGGKENVKGHSVDLLTQMQYSKLKEKIEATDLPDETN